MLVEGGGPSAQLHLSGTTKVQRAFISGVSGHTPWGFKAFCNDGNRVDDGRTQPTLCPAAACGHVLLESTLLLQILHQLDVLVHCILFALACSKKKDTYQACK